MPGNYMLMCLETKMSEFQTFIPKAKKSGCYLTEFQAVKWLKIQTL